MSESSTSDEYLTCVGYDNSVISKGAAFSENASPNPTDYRFMVFSDNRGYERIDVIRMSRVSE